MNNRLSDARKAEIRWWAQSNDYSWDGPAKDETLTLLNEIDALRERAEAAERQAVGWPKGWWCPHDHGFDPELGPVGCDLEGTERGCVCQDRAAYVREALARQSEANQCDGCRRGLPIDGDNMHIEQDGKPTMVCTADLYQSEAGQPETREGKVVITTNEQGDCVAVTRQDDEGRVLSVIWERPSPPPQGNAMEELVSLVEELCERIDHDAEDIGSRARPVGELVPLLGPAVNKARRALAAHAEPSPDMEEALAALDEMWGMPADDDERRIYYETLHRFIHASRGVPESIRRLPDQFMELANGSRRTSVVMMAAYRHAAQMVREAIAEADQRGLDNGAR